MVSKYRIIIKWSLCSLFEYYGENFELSEVVPAASIPIPRTIMIKYKKDKSKKVSILIFSVSVLNCFRFLITQERTDDHNRSGKQDKEEASMNFHKAMVWETSLLTRQI